MALPNNLVSDSTLVQEVVDVLRVCGGRAAVEQIAEVILELPRLDAHNASFDVRFLNHELARVYPGQRMCNTHLCTVKLARRLMPEPVNHRLHTIAEHFAVPIPNRHRAPDDARATAEIFIRLLAQLDRQGLRDLASARRYKSLVQSPMSKV